MSNVRPHNASSPVTQVKVQESEAADFTYVHSRMSQSRVVFAFLLAPAVAPLVIAVASLHPSMAGAWIVALGVAAFTYGTALLAGVPVYFLFRSKKWLNWWQFTLGGTLLGLLPALIVGFPFSLQGILILGPDHVVIGAISGFAFWAVAFAGSRTTTRSAA